jgi:hypothetical protein
MRIASLSVSCECISNRRRTELPIATVTKFFEAGTSSEVLALKNKADDSRKEEGDSRSFDDESR